MIYLAFVKDKRYLANTWETYTKPWGVTAMPIPTFVHAEDKSVCL